MTLTRREIEDNYGYLLSCLDTDAQIEKLKRLRDLALLGLAEGKVGVDEAVHLAASLTGISAHIRQCQNDGKMAYPNLQGDADVIEKASKALYRLTTSEAKP